MKVWYEVFISDNEGTQTIQICDTLKEATEYKKHFENTLLGKEGWEGTLHIDKWKNIENPTKIQEIE